MQPFHKTLITTQVIMIALAGGLMVVAGVIVYIVLQFKPNGFMGPNPPQIGPFPIITTTLCGMSAVVLLISFIIPRIHAPVLLAYLRKQGQSVVGEFTSWETSDFTWLQRVPSETLDTLLGGFLSTKIVMVALCEGAGMMCAVVYLLESYWIALALIVLAIVLILARVPTQSSLNAWLFTQVEQLRRKQ